MLGLFRPRAYYDRLALLDLAELERLGYRALLFDVDNTITTWNSPDIAPEVVAWFAALADSNLQGCIISNNSAERLRPLAEQLGLQFVSKARKPLPVGYKRAMRLLGVEQRQTLMIGDQLLTDILGANLAGVDSVLLKPISLAKEFRWTYVNRRIERLIIKPVLQNVPHNRF
ncbi:MAG: YqeG family HAD IIIA-type phosphatase [Firmicutes bacterium]|nr:YqeG family HAD IIIA-type phosphatase [Bacillota bacterium]MBQ3199284.1 YqeG family HAD IIIA-type phosphatase [Bacillota bacterium]